MLHGRVAPVLYDLVQTGDSAGSPIVGQVFGDASMLFDAFHSPGLKLRLENGRCASVVLSNCETRGAADVRVQGGMPWD